MKLSTVIKKVHRALTRALTSREWLIFYSQRYILERRVRSALSHSLALFLPRPLAIKPQSPIAEQTLRSFQEDGFAVLPSLISDNVIEEITEYLSTKELHGNTVHKYHQLEDILSAPRMLEILSNEIFVYVAENIFGCNPTLSEVTAWWLYQDFDKDEASKDHAFYTERPLEYHRDLDNWSVVRILIYLTDVSPGKGPHSYLKGTQKMNFPAFRAVSLKKKRFATLLGRKIDIFGNRGTAIVMNPYGLHRAVVPESSNRLMLGFSYSLHKTPFSPDSPITKLPANLSEHKYLFRCYAD